MGASLRHPFIGLSNKNVGRILGAKVGLILEVEQKKSRVGFGNCMKVRVVVDVLKPLKKGCWLSLSSGKRPGFSSNTTSCRIYVTCVIV